MKHERDNEQYDLFGSGGSIASAEYVATGVVPRVSVGDRKSVEVKLGDELAALLSSEVTPVSAPVLAPLDVIQGAAGAVPVPVGAVDAVKKSASISDAGEELVYNRRNRVKSAKGWGDVAGLNDALKVKEVVKTNIWLKPDYKQLIEDGMPPIVAHIVKQVYDSVAVKPLVGQRVVVDDGVLQRYMAGVKRVEAGVMTWARDTNALSQWTSANARVAGAMLGRTTSLSAMAGDRQTLLDFVYPGGIEVFRDELFLIGGAKTYSALQPQYEEIRRATKAIDKGWPSARESWEIQGFSVVENPPLSIDEHRGILFLTINNRTVESFESLEAAELAKSAIKPFCLFGKRGFVASFESEEQAIEGAKERSKKGRTEGKLIGELGVKVEAVERVGPVRRMENEDVSSERLVAEFGLKGVNFGNWLLASGARAEAQLHLNHAFDSFHDLADALGIPAKAVSLNGMLGLAIGAQGGGGGAAAHFVPGVNEINLTRTSGAGSLGHEWAHALDHYLAVQAGLGMKTEPFLTEHVAVASKVASLRPEIRDSFVGIVNAMSVRDETPEEAQADMAKFLTKQVKGRDSWLASFRKDFDGHEVLFDKLADRIKAGDVGDGMTPLSSSTYVSPVLVEVRDLYKSCTGKRYPVDNLKALQSWMNSVKWAEKKTSADVPFKAKLVNSVFTENALTLDKEKGGKPYWSTNVEKFARSFDAYLSDALESKAARNDYLSHTGRAGVTVPLGDERVTVNAAFDGLVGEFKVRETERGTALFSAGQEASSRTSMPLDAIHAKIRRLRTTWASMPPVFVVRSVKDLPFSSPENADGAYCDGKVYVVADNVADLKQLQKVMAHECVLHHSMESMLGPYGFSKVHKGIQSLKEAGDPTVVALAENILSRYGVLPPEIETKEIVARAGEMCLDESGNVKVAFGFMKSVFAGVAGWLRDQGLTIPFSNLELQGIMHDAGNWIKKDSPAQFYRESMEAAPVVLNSFAGVRAENAPLQALTVAREMLLAGDDDRRIWDKTGWTFAFADGKPRFEISDDKADVVTFGRSTYSMFSDMSKVDESVHSVQQFLNKHPDSPLTAEFNRSEGVRAAYEDMVTNDPSTAREIEKYLEHSKLYEAYPALAKIQAGRPPGIEGMVQPGVAAFVPDANLIKYSRIANADQFKSTTIHELQHAIQAIEGFAQGGSPLDFKPLELSSQKIAAIKVSVQAMFESNPEFAQACVKTDTCLKAVIDKYGFIENANEHDPVVVKWWDSVSERNSFPECDSWFLLHVTKSRLEKTSIVLSPEQQYSVLAGEAEARLSQVRLDMSPGERREGYPLDDMDVKVGHQAVSFAAKVENVVSEGAFSGKVLDVANGVAVQRISREGATVRHALEKLSSPVAIGEVLDIKYVAGAGVVSGRRVGIER